MVRIVASDGKSYWLSPDKENKLHSIFFRERVQISASGHTDADQLGTDFFRFR